tara:strand:+ start:16076 stop:16402 length:327 start_codon:yes stop_codon:yes gene_type:complete
MKMGYRSDVAVRFTPEAAKVVKIFAEMDNNIQELIEFADTADYDAGSFRWQHVKWYEDYPDITAFMDMLYQLHDEDYGMIRLGESEDDIERYGCPCDFEIWVTRSIEW